jgi:hypothetical protein
MRPTFEELTQLNGNLFYRDKNDVEKLLDAILECGYEWNDERKLFVHLETQEGINTHFLHEFTASSLKETYNRAWGNSEWLKEQKVFEIYFGIAKFGFVLFLFFLLSFIFINWKISLIGTITSLLIALISYNYSQSAITKRLKREGDYIDVKNLRWCKNCKYLKKTEYTKKGFCFSEEEVSLEEIPCKILNETEKVWEEFFKLPIGKRTLFPQQCPKWTK